MRKSIAIVGSGPNALMAAIILSNSGYHIKMFESYDSLGGGLRSYENKIYGTTHDICSAVHPLAILSPAFRRIGLHKSVPMVYPSKPYSHAFTEEENLHLPRFKKKISRFAGVAAHSMTDPFSPVGCGVGIALSAASSTIGWPIPVGGSQKILDFLISQINISNTEIFTRILVDESNYRECFRNVSAVIWDTLPEFPLKIINPMYVNKRQYRAAALKADYVTSSIIPWRDKSLSLAGTIHLGGKSNDIRENEFLINSGVMPKNPFVIVSQPSIFDKTRSPYGIHTVWAYAHVPNGTSEDGAEVCSRIIERYAPGFMETILDSNSKNAFDLEEYNPNYSGGDILSGSTYKTQIIPKTMSLLPWFLPRKNWFLCSSAVFPGPGVHGLGGMVVANIVNRTI